MTERAVFAGGCFWVMQDLIRRLDSYFDNSAHTAEQELESYFNVDFTEEQPTAEHTATANDALCDTEEAAAPAPLSDIEASGEQATQAE